MLYGVKLVELASEVPTKTVSNFDLEKILDTNDQWITDRTGIKERRICEKEDSLYLAVESSRKALKNNDPKEIDLIIVATSTPEYLYPSTACRLQGEIGADNAVCFDLSAACTGFIFALVNACQFLQLGTFKKALIVGIDIHSRFINWADRSTSILFGDGAGAILLEACPLEENQFLSHSLACYGKAWTDLTIKTTYSNFPNADIQKNVEVVQMNGKKIYQFAVQKVPEFILSSLNKANIKLEEVDYFICHQANQRILDSVADKLKVDKNKFPSNMAKYGNTSAASIPLIWEEKKNLINQKNNIISLSGFGAGLTIGSIVWKIN